jgi:neutral ceramidase
MKTWRWVFALVLCMTIYNASFAEQGNLRVGAAKVDITPSEKMAPGLKNVWGNSYRGIHDHTFVRAIVVGNGKDNAALVSIDTISATHTHNAPAVGAAGRQSSPDSEAFTKMVEDAFVEAVHQAKAKQQLGRMVLAQGHADLNVNRDEFVGDRWKTGRNPTRPSDKTVWVLRFDNAAGEPIAYMVNYGVHALTLGPDNDLVTGDFPGSTSRFIESYYKDKVVALWTSGPAGDQNLIATSWDLDDVLIHKVPEPGEAGFQLSDALGRILGEEAIRAAEASQDVTDSLRIYSEAKDVTCMGHRMDQEAYSHGELKFIDTQPQPLHLDLLMLDNIALAGVSAEVVTNIYLHLEAASPLRNTILMSLTKWAHNLYSR